MTISDNTLHSHYSEDKKLREFELIGEFMSICPDFAGYTFEKFSENPDMIFSNGSKEIGFDSIIISQDQAAANCYFEPTMCQVGIPTRLSSTERTQKLTVFFENKLFSHWRRYSLPTVLVFSLVDTNPTLFGELQAIAARFKLPEFELYNISDYYLCNEKEYIKIVES